MDKLVKLISNEDSSVNFVATSDKSVTESRYVRRADANYFICYLSTLDGCNKACRFCFLTRTGQVSMRPVTVQEMFDQALLVLDHYKKRIAIEGQCHVVHFNFMSRGEPLSSKPFVDNLAEYRSMLLALAKSFNLSAKFNISTIMPIEIEELDSYDFVRKFAYPETYFYYSMYSVNPSFRAKWLPNAMDPNLALQYLKRFQLASGGKMITFHWPYIENENDSTTDVQDVVDAITRAQFFCMKFNLVRYNTFKESITGRESIMPVLKRNFELMKSGINPLAFGEASKIVPRVGHDVSASCGMFVNE